MPIFKIAASPTTLRKLAAILILLVLLPALFYSAYEITALTQSEHLIQQIYRQQLDAVLFSLNQYAWDIADNWASGINRVLQDRFTTTDPRRKDAVQSYLAANKGIEALFVADTSSRSLLLSSFSSPNAREQLFQGNQFLELLQSEKQTVSRLLHLYTTGYRKLEGVPITSGGKDQSICLLFVANAERNKTCIAGVVIDAESFVRDVLRRKLDEAGGNEFILSVLRKSDHRQIYATGQLTRGQERQTKALWLFPDYILGIRLQGQTIDELVRERFYRNLALLAFLDLMIVAGVWFVYRTIRREMELAQLKADFVSNVSHELRTPLSLIRMFGETLEMGRVPNEEKKQEYYSTIVKESERLTGLVNNILDFSRIESGRKEYHLTNVDLNTIVKSVLSVYQAHLEHLGFILETELSSPLHLIHADPEALSEALINVVDNAVKYSDKWKSIKVRTGTEGRNVYVEVEDRGIGIPQEEQSKIFEKFYRVSTGLGHAARGSGIGLTLVRHIVDAHKGEITTRSKVGEGSTFRLSFPISDRPTTTD